MRENRDLNNVDGEDVYTKWKSNTWMKGRKPQRIPQMPVRACDPFQDWEPVGSVTMNDEA